MSRLPAVAALVLAGWTTGLQAAKVTVSGEVLGPDAQPVAGARIVAMHLGTDNGFLCGETQTDGAGRFRLRSLESRYVGDPVLVALGRGFALDWTMTRPGEDTILCLGARPRAIAGTVLGPDGRGLPNAQVSVCRISLATDAGAFDPVSLWPSGLPDDLICATSDDAGRFHLSGLPAEATVRLKFRAPGSARSQVSPALAPGDHQVSFTMQAEASVGGRVTHEGRPVAGLPVIVQGLEGSAYLRTFRTTTDKAGTYRIAGLPAGAFAVVLAELPQGLCATHLDVTLAAGQYRTDADFRLTPGAVLTGTVSDSDTGRPLPGARLDARGPASTGWGYFPRTALADRSGAYRLHLPAGTTKLQAWARFDGGVGVWMTPSEQTLELTEGETRTVDLTVAPPLHVHGRVLLPNGSPASGVRVGGGAWGDGFRSDVRPGDGAWTVTNARGEFRIPRNELPAPRGQGGGVAMAVDPGLGLAGAADTQDVKSPLTIHLRRGGYLTARVRDPQGHPAAGCRVEALLGENAGLSAESDRNGLVRLGPLPTGAPLRVRPIWPAQPWVVDDPWAGLYPLTLHPGETRELPPLTYLPQGRTLRGRITRPSGEPVALALVWSPSASRTVRTDALGGFVLSGLEATGPVTAIAVDPVRPLFALVTYDTLPMSRAEIALQPLGSVAGQLLGAEGKPVRGAAVHWGWRGPLHGGYASFVSAECQRLLRRAGYGRPTRTDSDGRWQVSVLPGVENNLHGAFEPAENTRAWQGQWQRKVTVGPGETLDLGPIRPAKP